MKHINSKVQLRAAFIALSAVIGISAIFCQSAQATDYAMGYGMNLSAKHDDNIRLVSTDKTAISGIVASPLFSLNANDETSTIGLNTLFSFSRYNDSGFNSDDINASGIWNKQFEKSNVGINLVAVRDSTTTSEIRDSGRIGTMADRHEHYEISPSWGYVFSEVDSIKLRATASADDYGSSDYIGYRNLMANIDWTHSLNERLRTILRATYSDYKSDDQSQTVPVYAVLNLEGTPFIFPIPIRGAEQSTSTESRSAGGLGGIDYRISEQNSLTLLVGMSRVTTEFPLSDPDNICSDSTLFSPLCAKQSERGNSFNAEVDWNWTGERNSIATTISKMVRPSSDGYPLDSWQVDANWGYQFDEASHLASTLSWGRNRILHSSNSTANAESSNRNYGGAGISYNQNVTENWQISAGFQYRYQNYTETDIHAQSRVITLAINYQPQSSHWSR